MLERHLMPTAEQSCFYRLLKRLTLVCIHSIVIFIVWLNLLNKISPSTEKNKLHALDFAVTCMSFMLPCMISWEHTFLSSLFIQE